MDDGKWLFQLKKGDWVHDMAMVDVFDFRFYSFIFTLGDFR